MVGSPTQPDKQTRRAQGEIYAAKEVRHQQRSLCGKNTAHKNSKPLVMALESIRRFLDSDPIGIRIQQKYSIDREGKPQGTLRAEARAFDGTIARINTDRRKKARGGHERPY